MRGARLIIAGVLAVVIASVMSAPASATAPGQNGSKIAFGSGDIFVMNTDGSGVVNLTNTPFLEHDERAPAWSPDGTQIAFTDRPDDEARYEAIEKMNADGTARALVGGWYIDSSRPDWSPGGEEIAFGSCEASDEFEIPCAVAARKPDGTAPRQIVGPDAFDPSWSPDGKRIAFARVADLYVANSNGTNITQITATPARESAPDWSPDGSRIVFESNGDGDQEIYSIEPDGSNRLQLTQAPGYDLRPSWAPDGSKILFNSDRGADFWGIYTMNPGGSDVTRVGTAVGTDPVWQPIPINAYPRPKGASPMQTSLVPAYQACTSDNRLHGPPLAFPSCAPPQRTPGQLTIGTADSNGRPTKSVSIIQIGVRPGIASTPADEADLRLFGTINDVRLASDLSDYTGTLEARMSLRITDKDNTPHPGGPGAGTTQDLTYSFPIACTATSDTTVGGDCTFETTAEAFAPGLVKELRRSVWELGSMRVYDGAGGLFMAQGVFE